MTELTKGVLCLLDQYKKRHGIASDQQLAKHLGITKAYLSYIRNGRRNAGAKMLQAIMANCKELVTPLTALMAKGGDAGR